MNTASIWVIFESNHEKNHVCQELMKKAKKLAKLQNTKAVAVIINKEQDKLVKQVYPCYSTTAKSFKGIHSHLSYSFSGIFINISR